MHSPIYIKLISILFIMLSSASVCATSITETLLIEKSLSYSEAKKLGLKADITKTSVRGELLEFRISAPETINGSKLESILSEVFSSEKSVALIHLYSYSVEKSNLFSIIGKSESAYQKYFYMNINPKIIDKVVLSIFCSEGFVYTVEVETNNL